MQKYVNDNETGLSSSLNAYAISKYNAILLAHALEVRFNTSGLIVHNVHPGLVDTPMLRGAALLT